MPRLLLLFLGLCVCSSSGKVGGWETAPNTQYHIQTDEGPERYFRYQTISGQYRKEKRLADGSVVGTYGWVDANGLLRLRDYVADSKGYRIVRTKMVHLRTQHEGTKPPQYSSLKPLPPISLEEYLKEGVRPTQKPLPPISLEEYLKEGVRPTQKPLPPISLNEYLKVPQVDIIHNSYPTSSPRPPPGSQDSLYSTTPAYVEPQTYRPFYNPNSIDYINKQIYKSLGAGRYESTVSSEETPHYDGVAFTHNGFRYYLPRHYHEEESLGDGKKAGSFGYIDPFGIRRVIYYNSSPSTGFVHRKNNKYVGFHSTPYDPRF